MGPKKCEAGKYLEKGECHPCPADMYSAEPNSLHYCQHCNHCDRSQNLWAKLDCTSSRNAVCECQAKYFCTNPGAESCTHCRLRTTCPPGHGANNTGSAEDTVCQPCKPGFYSNVDDYYSPCISHTNCTSFRRILKREGNTTTDSLCGPVKMTPSSPCPTLTPHSWILPAGLWVGLIVSVIVFAAYIYWKTRRQSRQTVNISNGHGGNISPVLAPDILPPPLELKDYKESTEGYKESTETPLLSCAVETSPSCMNCTCTLECDGGMSPIVTSPTSPMRLHPLAVTCVPGGESLQSTVCHSEPQEDEWPHQ